MKTLQVIIVLFSISFTQVNAQCCSPGNPAGGIGAEGILEKNTARISLIYKGGYSDTYFGGNIGGSKTLQPSPDFIPSIKNANYNYVGLYSRFGLTSRLTIDNELGYFINKTQNYKEGLIPSQLKGYGFTDFGIQFKYRLFNRREWEITPGIGLRFSVGQKEQKDKDGSTLPFDLWPTTGANAFTTSFLIYKGFPHYHLRFFLEGRVDFPQTAKVYRVDYKNGNIYSLAFISSYSFDSKWTGVILFRNEYRRQDIKFISPPQEIYSSGSNKIFIVPQIHFRPHKNWYLTLFTDIPVYQYYNGKQLGNRVAYGLNISRYLKFQSKEKSQSSL